MKGIIGESIAKPAPSMNKAPVVILILVSKSDLTWTVKTLPEIRFPSTSSNLTVTVASPIDDGIKLCHIIPEFRTASFKSKYRNLPSEICGLIRRR